MPKKNKSSNSKAINDIMDKLEKRYGEPVLSKMTDVHDIETITTGRATLDIALSGGWAVGKIIEIYAEEATGKTGLALEAIAVVQSMGGQAAIIDAEHALNTSYAERLGVNIDELLISQPSYGEQAIETIRALVSTGEVDLIVVDSVAAMIPKAELDGESGEAKMGLHARLMSQAMKQIAGSASEVGCTIIFLNQLRSTIASYGANKKPTGGNAIKFYASQRIEIKNKGKYKEGGEVVGFKQLVRCVKNKVGPPFKEAEFNIHYENGIDNISGTVEALIFEGILEKAGGWLKYDGTNVANGVKKFRTVIDDNPELWEELLQKLEEKRSGK